MERTRYNALRSSAQNTDRSSTEGSN